MGSTANPLFSSFVPGMNPSGNTLSLLDPATGSGKGLNALLPNTNLSPAAAGRTNPYDVVPTSAPSFPANAGPYASTGGATLTPGGGTTVGGTPQSTLAITGSIDPAYWDKMYKDLRGTYGSGIAQAIMKFLQGGAGYNQQAINNLLASLQPGIERGEEDLMSQFSVLGNRFGSGAQIGLGDYLSQVNLNEGQLVSQMYEQAVQNYINVLMGTAGTEAASKAASPSVFDSILGALGIGKSGVDLAGAIKGLIPGAAAAGGAGGGALGGILGDAAGVGGVGGSTIGDIAAVAAFA